MSHDAIAATVTCKHKNRNMKTFLFAWNPKKWNWSTLENSIDQIEQTGKATEKWSVISHKKIQQGDRAFLIRLGEEPKGIMAAGFVATSPFLSKHWSGEDKLVHRVMIDFEVILNPIKDPLLTIDILNEGNLAKVNWTPQSSGIEINPEFTDELEAVWFDFLTTQEIRHNPFKETEKDEQKVYTEGTPNQVLITKYERNPYARKTCINHYGLSCIICGINFKEKYGEIGKDFIHVHHLKQVADIGKEYKIDPITDLRPVCPNCHAMIHKRKEPYTIEEIKLEIKNASR
jgi:5-methylcytosine-specific restriction protein A